MDDFSEYEELLAVIPLHGTTTGQDIFKAVKKCIDETDGFKKCSAIATDGALAMIGSENGFVGHLRKNGINCLTFHCVIHQEALCGKSVRMLSAMKIVTKITNLIRGGNRSLSHRKWKTFLEEVDAEYGDLLLHSEIRWLSAGKCLVRFFALRKELAEFLSKEIKSDTTEFVKKLQDPSFLSELAFLTDFTSHLNNLNLNLQGKGRTISDMLANINGFRSKLTLFKCQLNNENVCHFPSCSELKKEFKEIKFSGFTSVISEVADQFDRRFQDFKAIETDLIFYNNPMKINVQCVKSDLQEEVCNLQNDPFMLSRTETDSKIFEVMPQEWYPKLIDFALYIKSLFASTYICESTFSIMKHIKSAQRCSLSNEVLEHQLRLATTQINIDIEELISNTKRIHLSH